MATTSRSLDTVPSSWLDAFMTATDCLTLRVPGRIHERLVNLALEHVDQSPLDAAAADAISRAKLKRRGGGFTAYVTLRQQDARVVAGWLEPHVAHRHSRDLHDLLLRWEITA